MPSIVVMQTGRNLKSPMVQVGNTIDISKSKSVEETMDKVKKEMAKGVVNDYTKHPHLKKLIEDIDAIEDMEQKYSRMKQCYIDLSMDTLSTKHMLKMDIENCMKIKEENEKLKEKNVELEKEVSLINSEEMENEEEIAKLKEKNVELQKKNVELKIQYFSMKKSLETIKKHNEDIEELKKPITNKDTRCRPFDVKVNANYIMELMEIKRDEIDFDDYELWDGFDEQVKEHLMIELANCINGYINQYCTKPSHQLWNEYLVEEFCGDVDKLLQEDYFSQYIKYDYDEGKYKPIKQED